MAHILMNGMQGLRPNYVNRLVGVPLAGHTVNQPVELVIGEKKMTAIRLINTNLRRYTFQSPKIKSWVESKCYGTVLNLFAGETYLSVDEVRNDVDTERKADFHKDALDFVLEYEGTAFDVVVLDPPYSYRKSMEMYNGKLNSRFKLIADNLPNIIKPTASVISFGYHSTFLGKKRGYKLDELCVFAHGGAQHCTIGIVEIAA